MDAYLAAFAISGGYQLIHRAKWPPMATQFPEELEGTDVTKEKECERGDLNPKKRLK